MPRPTLNDHLLRARRRADFRRRVDYRRGPPTGTGRAGGSTSRSTPSATSPRSWRGSACGRRTATPPTPGGASTATRRYWSRASSILVGDPSRLWARATEDEPYWVYLRAALDVPFVTRVPCSSRPWRRSPTPASRTTQGSGCGRATRRCSSPPVTPRRRHVSTSSRRPAHPPRINWCRRADLLTRGQWCRVRRADRFRGFGRHRSARRTLHRRRVMAVAESKPPRPRTSRGGPPASARR